MTLPIFETVGYVVILLYMIPISVCLCNLLFIYLEAINILLYQ